MAGNEKVWLSMTEASTLLGVHPTTLRRWADAGSIRCFRTPGGHRRFRNTDLRAWLPDSGATALVPRAESLVQSAVGYTRQQMSRMDVAHESWYAAFDSDGERQAMRDTGRRLFGLAIQYMSRTRNLEPVLQEGVRIGVVYGQMCADHGVSLVGTVRALLFFRDSLVRATSTGKSFSGQHDAEGERIQAQLGRFLDAVMDACLESYEAVWRDRDGAGVASGEVPTLAPRE